MAKSSTKEVRGFPVIAHVHGAARARCHDDHRLHLIAIREGIEGIEEMAFFPPGDFVVATAMHQVKNGQPVQFPVVRGHIHFDPASGLDGDRGVPPVR